MSSLALFLLLCVSMHACNARHLGVIRAEAHHFVENGDKNELLDPPMHANMKEMDSKALLKEEEETKAISGSEGNEKLVLSSLQQATTKLQGWMKPKARLMLGSTPQDAEETVDSKEEAGVVDDVVVMDYAQPHRKPPIHNEEH